MFRMSNRRASRSAATTTEWIVIICGVAIALLISVTVLGRKLALLYRAGTRSLDQGTAQRAPMPPVADLTGELSPTFAQLQSGNSTLAPTRGPLGTRIDHSSDFIANPARDPRSTQTFGQLLDGNPRGTNPDDFPATITLPPAFDAQNQALWNAGTGPQVGVAPPVTLEQGAIIVRQADGTYVMRPTHNAPPDAQPGSWQPWPYTQATNAGETVVGFTHAHPPSGEAPFLPWGFSAGDLRIGTLGAHDGVRPNGSTVQQDVAMMQIGNTTYMAVRTSSTPTPPAHVPTAAELNNTFFAAYNNAIANGASQDRAVLEANFAMAQQAGLVLYYGRSGEPLRRIH